MSELGELTFSHHHHHHCLHPVPSFFFSPSSSFLSSPQSAEICPRASTRHLFIRSPSNLLSFRLCDWPSSLYVTLAFWALIGWPLWCLARIGAETCLCAAARRLVCTREAKSVCGGEGATDLPGSVVAKVCCSARPPALTCSSPVRVDLLLPPPGTPTPR